MSTTESNIADQVKDGNIGTFILPNKKFGVHVTGMGLVSEEFKKQTDAVSFESVLRGMYADEEHMYEEKNLQRLYKILRNMTWEEHLERIANLGNS